MRRRLVLAAAALVALALPAGAFAHASLRLEQPGFGQELQAPPRQVLLQFDQSVSSLPKAIVVLDRRGADLVTAVRSIPARRELVAVLRKLPRGPYTIRWEALSNDGHVVSGVYTFGVGVKAPLVTDAFGAQGPTAAEHVVRWLYFVSFALLIGGLGFRLLVVRGPLPVRAERRFYLLVGSGAVAALEIGILGFLLRAEDALQLGFGRFFYGDLSPISGGTRFGQAFVAMELGFAFLSAVLFLAWLTGRRWLLWLAFALGLVFSSGLSLSGHSAADAGHSWLSELADWVHLTAATLWVGGLVQLVAVVWPAAPELRRTVFLRFSRLATVLVALLLGAGTYLSVLRLPRLHDLWTSGYGHVLLVKLGLVALALLWGAVHHFVAVPRIERAGITARIGRSMLGESAVAMAVLLAAAVLVDSKPPAQPPPQPPVAAQSRVAGR
ncbi:MAG: copper resistance CopC/CopD family protein [Gaiellaceae bacterium]